MQESACGHLAGGSCRRGRGFSRAAEAAARRRTASPSKIAGRDRRGGEDGCDRGLRGAHLGLDRRSGGTPLTLDLTPRPRPRAARGTCRENGVGFDIVRIGDKVVHPRLGGLLQGSSPAPRAGAAARRASGSTARRRPAASPRLTPLTDLQAVLHRRARRARHADEGRRDDGERAEGGRAQGRRERRHALRRHDGDAVSGRARRPGERHSRARSPSTSGTPRSRSPRRRARSTSRS